MADPSKAVTAEQCQDGQPPVVQGEGDGEEGDGEASADDVDTGANAVAMFGEVIGVEVGEGVVALGAG